MNVPNFVSAKKLKNTQKALQTYQKFLKILEKEPNKDTELIASIQKQIQELSAIN